MPQSVNALVDDDLLEAALALSVATGLSVPRVLGKLLDAVDQSQPPVKIPHRSRNPVSPALALLLVAGGILWLRRRLAG